MAMIRVAVSVLMVVASSCLCSPAKEPTIPPQAAPVAKLLKAIEEEDPELFKTCYSSRMRDEFATRGWQGAFFQYVMARKGGFRTNETPEIRYEFCGDYVAEASGDFVSGNVLVLVLDEVWGAFELDVIDEGGEWRIDDDRLARDVTIRAALRLISK